MVITFEYPEEAMQGPPFSVREVELRRHYEGFDLELLEEVEAENPRLREAGVGARERCFSIHRG